MKNRVLLIFSFVLVAFGQPAWSELLSILAALFGFACFWRVLIEFSSPKKRFLIACGWFGGVQLVQLSWMAAHPYLYIYGVILFCALLMGVQWGLIGLFIETRLFKHPIYLFGLAGLWTLLEWSRLFILSGLPFNPVGLALSGSLYAMQFASVGGVYSLSFLVILINLLVLRAWAMPFSWSKWAGPAAAASIPFLFGFIQLKVHEEALAHSSTLSVLLVQPALPIEEKLTFQSAEEARRFVLDEWLQTLTAMKDEDSGPIDLIVFPEYVVPYGTFHPIYPLPEVRQLFLDALGKAPEVNSYFEQFQGEQPLASNAFIAQALADQFLAHVVVGLEDSSFDDAGKKIESFSSAFHFIPGKAQKPARYEKRILVPMGEYIPFQWCRNLAAQYGISGSFTCGKKAGVFPGPVPIGISICYEELYSHMMRESTTAGAEMLVNLTNDGWFPHSRLPKQHFDHARLRTVENGVPLVRSCNTGVTGAVDSLGRVVALLGEDHMKEQEKSGSLRVDVPTYHYSTLYARFGNGPVLGLSVLLIGLSLLRRRFKV
jgi:apolipoprotein N-acyltransferase